MSNRQLDNQGRAMRPIKSERCVARQANKKAPDFECKITTAHSVHIDPRTGVRWGTGSTPQGMRRKYDKKYNRGR